MKLSRSAGIIYLFFLFFFIQTILLKGQPVSTREDIQIKELAIVNTASVRIAHDPVTGNLYTVENDGDIKRVEFGTDSSVTFITVYQESDHGLSSVLGIAFGTDGSLYLAGNETNQSDEQLGTGIIAKGVPVSAGSEERNWNILAQTVDYLYGFTYNHRMSGIIVDPDNDYIYVNSGARTDHGEEREGYREVGLTSIILKLPVDGNNITLENDREWLRNNGYLYAEGIRNTFDFAFAVNGDLFGVENSGDRDDPEELNWIREGHHYGFPWIIGGNRTPQQFSPYDPVEDPLLNPLSWGGGNLYETFSNDTSYPAVPDMEFSEAVLNAGPDADKFRDSATGNVQDAGDLGETITTFTPHRSPNGIVIDKDSLAGSDLKGGAFVISLASGNTFQPFGDTSQDLLHLSLTKQGDENYTAEVHRIVSGFDDPLGIEIVGNKIFVLETGLWGFPANNDPKLWQITLPENVPVGVEDNNSSPHTFTLFQNYPNPFNPSTKISFFLPQSNFTKLEIFNELGSKVEDLIYDHLAAGNYEIEFDASKYSSGVYFFRLTSGNFSSSGKMIFLK